MDAADGLGQDHADVHRFDFAAAELLHVVRDGVGHHHLQGREQRRDAGRTSEGIFTHGGPFGFDL